jgi:hypothetical protein
MNLQTRVVFAAALVLSGAKLAAQDQPLSTAVVQLSLDTSYRSEASLEQIRSLSDISPPRQVTFSSGDTISALIARSYGFGVSDLPRAYHEIERAIRQLNGIQDLYSVPAGNLKIPSLPRVGCGTNTPSATAKVSLPAKVAAWRTEAPAVDDLDGRFAQIGTATETLFRAEIPAAYLRTPAGQAFVAQGLLQAAPMEIAFASAAADVQSTGTDTNLLAAIGALAKDARRTTRLLILDSGWPPEQATESWNALADYVDVAGAPFGLTAPRPPTGTTSTSLPKNTHAVTIAAALSELVRADTAHRVKVIFVPLSRDQNPDRCWRA